jgi:F-type H+-transporting ATPase subunit gamma
MPSTREIRRRIKSIKNISQVTRAMEMVAASRMRRAQQAVLAGRPYAEKIDQVIANLAARMSGQEDDAGHPLLAQRPIKRVGVVLITADRGLCGSLNTNIIRRATRFILDEAGGEPQMVTVGKKGRDFMIRYGRPVVAEFINYGDRPGIVDIAPIARVITEEFTRGHVDSIQLIYTDFVNTLIQRPMVYQLLPLRPAATDTLPTDYIYEPSTRQVLEQLIPRYIESRIYQGLLESIASEQSARMVAMRNATQNAKELVQELTLSYNKLRQSNITRELTEISGGVAALNG